MSKTRPKTGRSAVIVLGMHRSGTSALAGVLSLLGCDTPATLLAPNQNNEKGYFESSKLYRLHTDLFASAATQWDDWLPMPAGWFDGPRAVEFHERAVETVSAEFGQSSLFLIKDPRICRLVPFWEGVLAEEGVTPRYVLTHRNPLEVAASLRKRDGLSTGHGLLIWLRHVLEAEHGTRGQPRCFTSFVKLMTNWAGVAEQIQTSIGLNLPRFTLGVAPEVDAFLEGSLRHHHEASEKVLNNPMLSSWVRDTYAILERWVAEGEASDDHARLDEIRAAFNASGPAFAEVIQSGRSRAESLSGELGKLKEEQASVATRMDELRVGGARREETANQLREELAQAKTRIVDLEEAAGSSEVAKAAQSSELEELRRELAQREAALEKGSRDAEKAHNALETLRAEVAIQEQAHAEKLSERDRLFERLQGAHDTQAVELDELRRMLARREGALDQSSREADELRRSLEALRTEHGVREAAHSAQLAERDRALERLEKARDAQSAELEELRHRLSQEQSALEQRSHEADETHKALEALQAELAERDLAHTELQRAHEAAVAEAAALRESLSAAETRLQDRDALFRGQIAARTEQVQTLEMTLKGQYRELAEMTRILANKESEIEHERKSASQTLEQERKTAAQALERERTGAREALERERSARTSSEARVTALDNQLQTQFREMSELSRLLSRSEQALTAARMQSQADLAAVQSRLDAQKADAQDRERVLCEEIQALRTSSSWRLTQPLRSVVDWVRGNRP